MVLVEFNFLVTNQLIQTNACPLKVAQFLFSFNTLIVLKKSKNRVGTGAKNVKETHDLLVGAVGKIAAFRQKSLSPIVEVEKMGKKCESK